MLTLAALRATPQNVELRQFRNIETRPGEPPYWQRASMHCMVCGEFSSATHCWRCCEWASQQFAKLGALGGRISTEIRPDGNWIC